MIPGVLAPPPPAAPVVHPGRVARRAGVALLGLAVVGAVVWVLLLSPYGYKRVEVGSSTTGVSFRQAGTYTIFVEYPGAAAAGADAPRLEIVVRSPGGRRLGVRNLQGQDDVATYDVPGHEGRAVGEVTVDNPTAYQIAAYPVVDDPASGGVPPEAQLAIGRDLAATWMATWWGLVPFVVLPLALGVTALVVGSVQGRRAPAAG